ncbi:MAG TPA: hypothetical protein VIL20_01630 [Sandaracinaceae bacterium]
MIQPSDEHLPDPSELERELARFAAQVQQSDGGDALDFSYVALDRVEAYLGSALKSGTPDRNALLNDAAWYVGETLARNTGGVWALRRDTQGRKRPHVTRLPELGKYAFLPSRVVSHFARAQLPRILRDRTEVYDIPHRRRFMDLLLASREPELAALDTDVQNLLGDGKKLDRQLASLDRVEEAIARLIASQAPNARVREMQARAVLHVGEVMKEALPEASWHICTEPENAAIGELVIADFAPMDVIRYITPGEPPGVLRKRVEFELKARQG